MFIHAYTQSCVDTYTFKNTYTNIHTSRFNEVQTSTYKLREASLYTQTETKAYPKYTHFHTENFIYG